MYTKPTVVKYGNSTELIQGSCGVGIEWPGLDKTDGSSYTIYTCSFWTQKCSAKTVCETSRPSSHKDCSYDGDTCLD